MANTLSKKLTRTRKKIVELQRKQDDAHKKLIKSLGVADGSLLDEYVWDYLFNGGKVKNLLKVLKAGEGIGVTI